MVIIEATRNRQTRDRTGRTQRILCRILACATLLRTSPAHAQPAKAVPIRNVSPPVESPEPFLGAPPSVRSVSGGRLVVNDQRGKRLMLFDSTFKTFTVTADSARESGALYPSGLIANPLIRFVADSSLLVDFDARVFVVVDPNGRIAHSMAPVDAGDLFIGSRPWAGNPGGDNVGRLIFRGNNDRPNPKPGDPPITATRDTLSIVRADFNRRVTDTIGFYGVPRVPNTVITQVGNKFQGSLVINAGLTGPDEFVVLSDGTLAVVREHDYAIDWIAPDGTKSTSAKIPHESIRQTDEMKQARIDSTRRIIDSTSASGRPYGLTIRMTRSTDGGPSRRDSIVPTITFAPLGDMADYPTPFRRGQVKADERGNVWVLPTVTSLSTGGLVYDVINQKAGLYERVRIPADYLIIGFGKGDEVYLAKNDVAKKAWTLARVRVVR